MKKLSLLLLSSLFVLSIFAQGPTDEKKKKADDYFGIDGGVNYWRYTGDSYASGSKYKFGFQVGALYNFPIANNFRAQPEVGLYQVGAKFSDMYGGDVKYTLYYIHVGGIVQYVTQKNAPSFIIETGPSINFLVSAHAKSGSINTDIKSNLKSTDFGWNIGVGYQINKNLSFDLRYYYGFSNIASSGGNLKNAGFLGSAQWRF